MSAATGDDEESHWGANAVNNGDVVKFLGSLLVVAVGSRDGKVPSLPALYDEDLVVELLVDTATSSQFATVAQGLRSYAQVTKLCVAVQRCRSPCDDQLQGP